MHITYNHFKGILSYGFYGHGYCPQCNYHDGSGLLCGCGKGYGFDHGSDNGNSQEYSSYDNCGGGSGFSDGNGICFQRYLIFEEK